jgi:dihydrofolate synthase / folylpolyglutamate synthase
MNQPGPIRSNEARSILSFSDAQDFLFRRLQDTEKILFKDGEGLARSRYWLEQLNNPQEAFTAIHLAGTSGKGSTSYFLSAILSESGRVVGTHVSPHVYDIRERLLLDGQYISEEEFTLRVRELIPKIAEMESTPTGRPTYFEVTNALAMQVFKDNKVDYAVIETGIGGRYDSTNTIRRADKLAVITRLGLDHTELLGDTVEKIAWQKGGIIPENGVAFALLPHEPSAARVLQKIADERHTELYFIDPTQYVSLIESTIHGTRFHYHSPTLETDIFLSALGAYQIENATVAIEVAEYTARRDGWTLDADVVQKALAQVRVPGRAEVREYHGHLLILDSAHNPQKLAAFFALVETLKLQKKPKIIFAAKNGKDWAASLPIVAKAADTVYFTEFFQDQPPHLKKYAVTSGEFQHEVDTQQIAHAKTGYDRPIEALEAALKESEPEQPIIVVGSMYMLGEFNGQLKQTM